MNLPAPRIRIRTLIVVIAVCAVSFQVGHETWGDKTGRWLATLESDRSELRRKEAASSLAENASSIDPDLAMPTLTAALKDGNVGVRRSVAAVLFQLGTRSDSAIPALVRALKDEDVVVRMLTVEGLGDCVKMDQTREIVLPALMEALGDKSNMVRCRSARSLTRWGAGERGVSAMVEILRGLVVDSPRENDRAHGRRVAAETLERIGPAARAAVPALIEATKDGDIQVRVSAACALVAIGERDAAIPALRAASAGPDPSVASMANRALKRIKTMEVTEKP